MENSTDQFLKEVKELVEASERREEMLEKLIDHIRKRVDFYQAINKFSDYNDLVNNTVLVELFDIASILRSSEKS